MNIKMELKLESDSYNVLSTSKLIIQTTKDKDIVWLKIGDREVSVNRTDFIKVLQIIWIKHYIKERKI